MLFSLSVLIVIITYLATEVVAKVKLHRGMLNNEEVNVAAYQVSLNLYSPVSTLSMVTIHNSNHRSGLKNKHILIYMLCVTVSYTKLIISNWVK